MSYEEHNNEALREYLSFYLIWNEVFQFAYFKIELHHLLPLNKQLICKALVQSYLI